MSPGRKHRIDFVGGTGGCGGWEQEGSGVCAGKSTERDDRKMGAFVSEVETQFKGY